MPALSSAHPADDGNDFAKLSDRHDDGAAHEEEGKQEITARIFM